MNIRVNLQQVKYASLIKLKVILGKDVRIIAEDREVLENLIFPYYLNRSDIQRVLFVGCAPYTVHYRDIWKNKVFWTIDIDPRQKRYGAVNHVVGSIEDLSSFFPKDHFDLIVCNGVYGFGLNSKESCERAFSECFAALRPGGEFILGWNQAPQYNPLSLNDVSALKLFHPKSFPPLGTRRYECEGGILHTFDFFVTPSGTPEI